MNGPGAEPDTPEVSGPEVGPYALLRNGNFLSYLIARFISSFGQQMLAGVVGWEIYDRTNSKLMLGYVGLVQVIPMFLFTFPAGHVADNYNRKSVIQWMQAVICAASATVAGDAGAGANAARRVAPTRAVRLPGVAASAF